MRLPTRALAAPLSLAVAALALSSCAPRDEEGGSASSSADSSESASAEECAKGSLDTYQDGTLTVATDDPAYEPWFMDNDPANGRGYEAAVAYAIADELGYAEDEVTWVRVPFNAVVQPREKKFDLDLNQVSITEERRKAVDFSSGYYDVRQVVITRKGTPLEGAKTLADLADAKLGAQVGTTSFRAIEDQIGSSQEAAPYDTNDQAVQALNNGQIDGIVVDLPTAFYMVSAQIDDGVIIGQFDDTTGGEEYGIVLPKGSKLTPTVSAAVDSLAESGKLAELQEKWLNEAQNVPILK